MGKEIYRYCLDFKSLLVKLTVLALLSLSIMYYLTKDEEFNIIKSDLSTNKTLKLSKRNFNLEGDYKSFLQNWCLQRENRFDWIKLLKSCGMFLEWTPHRLYWKPIYITNAKLSYVSYAEINTAGQYSRILIQSVTQSGVEKNYGGDSWRVHVKGTTSVPVYAIDQRNGSYEVIFLISDPGIYVAEIILDYTLCDGMKDPPDNWFMKGNTQGKYQSPNTLPGSEHPYLLQPLHPPFEFTVHKAEEDIMQDVLESGIVDDVCPLQPCLMWDGYGRWKKGKWQSYRSGDLKLNPTPHAQGKGIFWIYGDSVGDFLYHSLLPNRHFCSKIFKNCLRTYNWIYKLQNENITQAKLEWDNKDFDIGRVLKEIEEVLFDERMDEHSVLLLNLGLHYVQDIQFSTYQQLITSVIRLLSSHAESPDGFHGKVIWKTTTAMFRERYGDPVSRARHAKTIRFLTIPRLELFNAYATSAMCDAQIDVIDIYPMSDSYPLGTGAGKKKFDALHYSPNVFKSMEGFLEEYFS